MNVSSNATWTPAVCQTCQISSGLSATERRGIIVVVVLVSLALAGCFVGVLWYAIRTRTVVESDRQIVMEQMQRSDSYQPDEETMSDLHRDTVPITPRI